MKPLPELSECLANELAVGIEQVAEPYRTRLVALLKVQSGSELVNLKAELANWLAQMETVFMVKQYTQTRQLIHEAAEIFRQEAYS